MDHNFQPAPLELFKTVIASQGGPSLIYRLRLG
jgi:hypothetical protein